MSLRSHSVPALPLLIVLAATSCSRPTPNAPTSLAVASNLGIAERAASSLGAFFPLASGNTWRASADDYFRVEPSLGPPYNEVRIHTDFTRIIVGTETLFDRPYTVLEETWTANNPFTGEPRTGKYWIRYRQDGSGLYEADVAATIPPNLNPTQSASNRGWEGASVSDRERIAPLTIIASVPDEHRAPYLRALEELRLKVEALRPLQGGMLAGLRAGSRGGLLDGEITRLRYPLAPGRAWVIRPDPFFGSLVEAVEAIVLPAGRFPSYRIRIDNEALGPLDVVHAWYGRSGQLAIRYHLESVARDSEGREIGRVIDDYVEELREVELVEHPDAVTSR